MSGAANGQPFDLDAAAKAIETEAEPFYFTYAGEVYEMRNPGLIPIDLSDKIADAQGEELDELMNRQLGGEVYTRLKEAGINNATLKKLMEAATDAAGFGSTPNSSKPAKRAATRR